MKKINIGLSLVIGLLLFSQSTFAQKLVTAKELKTMKGVTIIDTRKAEDYAKNHIKGAINLPITVFEKPGTIKGLLKSSAQIATKLGENGITRDTKIVLYCKTGTNAGRMFWILDYVGAKNVSILDGQFKAWFAARGALTKAKPTIKKTTFTPVVNIGILVNKAYVKSKTNSSSSVIIDARKTEDFKAGNIPGSTSLPKENIVNANYTFKDKATLQALFTKVGATPNKEIIFTCKSGSRAGTMYFLAKEVLNYPNVKIYDGSYNEWKGL